MLHETVPLDERECFLATRSTAVPLVTSDNVLRAYIAQVFSNRWAILYATTMVCCWTLLRIVGSWTRNCAWIVRRRGRLQRIAEKVLFPKDCNACHR